MSKKSDNYYFKNFVICAEYGEEAARMLERNLKEFDVTHLSERLDEIHGIEHAADQKKHEMLAALVKEFITPIEREDIILLSEAIDEVKQTGKIVAKLESAKNLINTALCGKYYN